MQGNSDLGLEPQKQQRSISTSRRQSHEIEFEERPF